MVGPSRLSKIMVCHAREPFVIDYKENTNYGSKESENLFIKRGKRNHADLESFFLLLMENKLHHPFNWVEIAEKNDFSHLKAPINRLVELLSPSIRNFGYKITELQPEYRFESINYETYIVGEIDLLIKLEKEGNSKLIIVDWKSNINRKNLQFSENQVKLYAQILRENDITDKFRDSEVANKAFLVPIEKVTDDIGQPQYIETSDTLDIEKIIERWKNQEYNPTYMNCITCDRVYKKNHCNRLNVRNLSELSKTADKRMNIFRDCRFKVSQWKGLLSGESIRSNELGIDTVVILHPSHKNEIIFNQEVDDNGIIEVRGIASDWNIRDPSGEIIIKVLPKLFLNQEGYSVTSIAQD